MTDFTHRAAAVMAQVLDFVGFLKKEIADLERAGTLTPERAASADQERDHFSKRVPEYFEARQKRLNALIEALGGSPTGGEPSQSWRTHTEGLISDAQILRQILKDVEHPSEQAAGLKWRIEAREMAFNKGLAGADIPKHYEQTAKLHIGVQVSILTHRAEWDLLTDKATEIAGRAESAVGELVTALTSGPGSADSWTGPAERAVQAVKALAAKASSENLGILRTEADANFTAYGKAMDDGEQYITKLRSTVEQAKALVARLRSLQEAEIGTLHRLFREQRQKVAEYVKEPPPQRTRTSYEAASSTFGSWMSTLPSDAGGMKEDAEALREELLTQLAATAAEVSQAFAEYISENEGVFFGSLTDSTIAALSKADVWNGLRTKVTDVKFDATLRAASDLASRRELDISPAITALTTALSGSQDPNTDTFLATLPTRRDELTADLTTRRTDLRPVVEAGLSIMDGPELTGLLNRQAVHDSLKA